MKSRAIYSARALAFLGVVLTLFVLMGVAVAQGKKEQGDAKQKVASAQSASSYRPWLYCVNTGLGPLQQHLNNEAKSGFELVDVTAMPDATRKNSKGEIEIIGKGCALYLFRKAG